MVWKRDSPICSSRNDTVLIVSNGVFGDRKINMATRLGANVVPVSFPASSPIDLDKVRQVAREIHPKVIAAVHGETSTGVMNPVKHVAEIAKEVGALMVVDAGDNRGHA